jgi:hypothetical protein
VRRRKTVVEQTPDPVPLARATPAANRLLRWVGTVFVVAHFSALLSAAGSVGPTSELITEVWRVFRPYLQFFFLNHGYNYYAPEPAPSTLLDYEVEGTDGSIITRGRLPNHGIWPRLLYHRYLLLTEHIAVAPPMWQHHWYRSYARHLCRKYGGAKVRLTRLTHSPPTMGMVRDGTRLDDPVTYMEMPLGEFACGE